MAKLPITAIILTKDEELNLPACLKSIAHHVGQIIVVDSHSKDRTQAIAKEFGAEISEREFLNQADQFNWALDNLEVRNDWILRLDADESMSEELWKEIGEELANISEEISGFYLPRRVYFMGRWIKHGGYYPTFILRMFRKGKARSEERAMDEHIVLLEGRAKALSHDFKDDNRKSLHWWIQKHNNYATREAESILAGEEASGLAPRLSGSQAERKRWLKVHVYGILPLFLRPALYFIYRYFFRMGFLDGKEGAIFHFLQGFWYRFLVDAKVYEMRRKGS